MNYEPKDLAIKVAKILADKKAEDIQVINIADITVLADYFVICTGNNSTHVRTLGEEVDYMLGKDEIMPHHIEGHRSTEWILLDYGSVVVHVFYKESREFYNLERLWQDGVQLDLDEILK